MLVLRLGELAKLKVGQKPACSGILANLLGTHSSRVGNVLLHRLCYHVHQHNCSNPNQFACNKLLR